MGGGGEGGIKSKSKSTVSTQMSKWSTGILGSPETPAKIASIGYNLVLMKCCCKIIPVSLDYVGGGCGVGVGLGWGRGAMIGAKYLLLTPSFETNKSGPNWLHQLQDRFRALKFTS